MACSRRRAETKYPCRGELCSPAERPQVVPYSRPLGLLQLQGDVIGLLNSTGDLVARYVYDAWGQPISITDGKGKDVSGDPSHIANRNPLRYRGYYYDQETGFYYLQSRYYDPVLCRFINADSFASTGQGFLGYNMYVYCNNCPVGMRDSQGGYPTNTTMLTDSGAAPKHTPDEIKYGAAPDYVPVEGNGSQHSAPNCYAYAIGYFNDRMSYSPGDFSMPYGEYTLESVTEAVLSDMKVLGRSARIIKSYDSPIRYHEYRIALRVKTVDDPKRYNINWDYHFMIQTSTGRWAEKSGPSTASVLYAEGITPENAPWSAFGQNGYYDSPIVYFAISW